MSILLNDNDILELIQERKILPEGYTTVFQMREKKGHKEQEVTIKRNDDSLFKLILRQNITNVLDFSVILGYMPSKSNVLFRLTRYNGRHTHTNKIEGGSFYDFHIHLATQRYQEKGYDEDAYAQASSAYSDIRGAMECLIKDCNIILPEDRQPRLF
ncbi:MAG: hypothetical protein Q8P28_04630 [Deltaproteobacteria bacterium]|nr:hypothetical protein [Deltaproteobacteria bacterium]